MNKYLLAVKKIIFNFGNEHYTHLKAISQLDEQNERGTISKNSYDNGKATNIENYHSSKKAALVALEEQQEKYEADVKAWAVLDGSKINAQDIAILNSGINLTRKDYEQLEDKYAGNYSMLRAIYDSAKKNKVSFFEKTSVDVAVKMAAFRETVQFGLGILHHINMNNNPHDGYSYRLWEHDGSFEKIYEKANYVMQIEESK